jgi:hypothetical protein
MRLERVTGLARVHCARCGRPIAAATDAAHPASAFEGRVVCLICLRAQRVADILSADLPEPSLEVCIDQWEEWVRAGLVEFPFEPDPRPKLREWLRSKFRRSKPKR